MRFRLYWGTDDTARINSVEDLDLHLMLLTRGRRGRIPYAVDLLPAGALDGGLQFGVGHRERSFVLALDPPGGYAVEPGVAPWTEPITFDYGHELVELKPDWTRVTAQTDLQITGPQAQFGRGVIEDVGKRVLGEFSSRLEQRVAGPKPEDREQPGPDAGGGAAGPPGLDVSTKQAAPGELDVGTLVTSSQTVRRGAAVAAGLVLLALILLRRRR